MQEYSVQVVNLYFIYLADDGLYQISSNILNQYGMTTSNILEVSRNKYSYRLVISYSFEVSFKLVVPFLNPNAPFCVITTFSQTDSSLSFNISCTVVSLKPPLKSKIILIIHLITSFDTLLCYIKILFVQFKTYIISIVQFCHFCCCSTSHKNNLILYRLHYSMKEYGLVQ